MSRRTKHARLPRTVPVGQLRRNLESVQRFRLNFVFGALLVILLGLLGRLGKLQIVDAATFRSEAAERQTREHKFHGQRGRILDARGRVLATSRPALSVSVDRHAMRQAGTNPRYLAEKLALLLDAESEADSIYQRIVQRPTGHVTIRREVEDERIASRLRMVEGYAATIAAGLGGLRVQATEQRTYPNGSYAAHVTGRAPSPGDLDNPGCGLERTLDASLQGDDVGVPVQRDAGGRYRASLALDPILTRGQDVRLTLDVVVQHYLEQALDEIERDWSAELALGIVLDPHTGHVLALANRPTFDPNTEPATYNHAVQNLFPPGSIFKPLVVGYGLGQGVLGIDERLPLPRRMDFSWRRATRTVTDLHDTCDWDGQGDVVQMIKASSNVGVAQILWRVMGGTPEGTLDRSATAEPAFALLRRPGLLRGHGPRAGRVEARLHRPQGLRPHAEPPAPGRRLGLRTGLQRLPDAHALRLRRPGPRRRAGRPSDPPPGARRRPGRPAPRLRERRPAGRDPARDSRRASRRGRPTGRSSAVRIQVAGKTGTAEIEHGATVFNLASFAGFAPRERPRLAVLVMAKVDEDVRTRMSRTAPSRTGATWPVRPPATILERTLAYLDGRALDVAPGRRRRDE